MATGENKEKGFHDFIEATTFHGIRYIFRREGTYLRKFLWVLVVVTSVSLFLFQVIDRSQYYFAYNSNVNVEVMYKNTLEFPSVTICNQNNFRISEAVKYKLYLRLYQKYSGVKKTIDRRNKTTTYPDIPLRNFTVEAGHQKIDFITSCQWNGYPCNLDKDFERIFTDFGVCYTFNHKHMNNTLVVTKSGVKHGLSLLLNIEEYEYMVGPHDDIGVKILLHDQKDFPLMEEMGFTLAPGTHAFIGIKRTEIASLEPPYGSCNASAKPRSFCLLECEAKRMIEACHCQNVYMENIMPNVSVCNYKDIFECVLPDYDYETEEPCSCAVPCRRASYAPDLSYARLSDATVTKVWTGRDETLEVVRKRYKSAKEIVHRVDPSIVRKDTSVFEDIESSLAGISDLGEQVVFQLLGEGRSSSYYGPISMTNTQSEDSLMATIAGSARSLNNAYNVKLERSKNPVNHSEIVVFMHNYRNNFTISSSYYNGKPPYRSDLSDYYLPDCKFEQDYGYSIISNARYCERPNISSATIIQIEHILQGLESTPFDNYMSVLNDLFPNDAETRLRHLQMYNLSSCSDQLFETSYPLHTAFQLLLQDTISYNATHNFTERIALLEQIITTTEMIFNLTQVKVCDTAYDECTSMSESELLTLQYRSEYEYVGVSFEPIRILSDQIAPLVMKPMYGYLNGTIATKEELFAMLHSADMDFYVLQIHALISMLKQDQFHASVEQLKIFQQSVIIGVQNQFKCSMDILNRTDVINSSVVHFIDRNYTSFVNIANQTAILKSHFLYSSLALSSLLEMAFEQQMTDFDRLVDGILNHTNQFSNLMARTKKELEDFGKLDSLIMDVDNYIKVDLFYQEMSYTSVQQQKAFEFVSLLSEVGGFLGLLLGASVLTVCELVDYLTLTSLRGCKKGRAVNNINVKTAPLY